MRVRLAWAGLAILTSGCLVDIDYGGTRFSCVETPICPGDFECVAGVCQPPGSRDAGAGDSGIDAGAGARQTLSVVAALDEAVADAPVMVRLTAERIDYGLAGDGADLRFEGADGAPLAHEIERWDPAGESIVWVKLPVLDSGATFSMIYGDGVAAAERPAEVWAVHDLVYHLTGSAADSRSAVDGTPTNGAAFGAGRLADAALLDGVDDYVEIGAELPLLRAASAATVSMWIRPAALRGSMVEIAISTGETSRMFANLQTGGLGRLGIRTQDVVGGAIAADAVDPVAVDEWAWLLFTADFAAQTAAVYVNGAESARLEMLAYDATTPDTNSALAVIGSDDTFAVDGFFPGAIDEVRLASRAVDAAWAQAQFLSMTDALLGFELPP